MSSKIFALKANLANKMCNTGLLKSTLNNHKTQVSKKAAYSSIIRPLISEYEWVHQYLLPHMFSFSIYPDLLG